MSEPSSVYIEPELKAQAEQVLSRLGIPIANAVNLFLRQIVAQNDIPLGVKPPHPLDYSKMTKEQFDAEMQKGLDSIREGRLVSAKEVRERMQRLFDV